jgi:hypothetical protein
MGAYCWSGSVNGLNSNNSGSWTIYIPESDVAAIASLSGVEPGAGGSDPVSGAWVAETGGSLAPVLAAANVTSVTGYILAINTFVNGGFLLITL